jgi:hypothetical protein
MHLFSQVQHQEHQVLVAQVAQADTEVLAVLVVSA